MTQTLFAPGKLFVFGEWAVLEGADALLVPVPYGQRATLKAQCATTPTFVYACPEFLATERTWRWHGDSWIEEGDAAGGFDVLSHVLAQASSSLTPSPVHLELHVATEGLTLGGHKLGFGSSGALAALVAKALVAMSAGADAEAVLHLALDGHHAAQGGRGSGADVAVSVLCKPLIYQIPDAPGLTTPRTSALRPNLAAASQLEWPMFAVFSGQSANTRELMAAVARFSAGAPRRYAQHIERMSRMSTAGILAWQQGNLPALKDAWTGYGRLVAELGQDAGVALELPAHQRIRAIAEERGCVAKTSGAGGGDMSIVLAPNPKVAKATTEALTQAGFPCFELPCHVD